jgi:hypothetical protein
MPPEGIEGATARRSLEIALLVPAARPPRNRRPIEVAFCAIAALVAGLAAVVAKSAPEVDDKVGGALDAVPVTGGWLST